MENSTVVFWLIFAIIWIACGAWSYRQTTKDDHLSEKKYRLKRKIVFAGGIFSALAFTNQTP